MGDGGLHGENPEDELLDLLTCHRSEPQRALETIVQRVFSPNIFLKYKIDLEQFVFDFNYVPTQIDQGS